MNSNKHHLLCHSAVLMLLLLIAVASGDDRPNIVLIMADDLGFSDVGCYGGEIHTPHIDGLAERGLRFTQFYNCARCVPTRASLLTGLYPQQADGKHSITLAEVLRLAGYRTLMSGKWHGYSGLPWQRGFDRYYGVLSGSCNFFNPGSQRPGELKPAKDFGEVRPFGVKNRVVKPYTPDDPNWYATDAFTDHAINWLKEYADDDQPFFLYVSHIAPHHPLQAPEDEIAKYRGRYRSGWDELRERRWQRLPQLGIATQSWRLSPRTPNTPAWNALTPKQQDQWDLSMAVYAAMVDRMDQQIGRLLATLRETGEEDNTLVLFLSDNGACAEINNQTPDVPPGPMNSYRTYDVAWANASNTPFRRFKRDTYEGGICTPLIVRWPNVIRSAGITRDIGHVVDFMPTVCDLANIDYPAQLTGHAITPTEGRSLVPILRGESRSAPELLCWEHLGNKGVRQGRWKLVGDGDPAELSSWELYDLSADRCEVTDLAEDSPALVRKLAQAWVAWAERTGWMEE